MLDLSWSHILILLIVALVVVGPKDLPRLMRMVGQWMGKARQMADQFKRSFDDMARQAELDELRKEIESLRSDKPFAGVERDLHQSIVPEDMRGPPMTPLAPQSVTVEAAPIEVETAPPGGESFQVPDPHFEEVPAEPVQPMAAAGYKPPTP